MSDLEWVSVSAAARRLGVSRTAIHNRIKRGTLSRMTDNHGNPLVQVSVTSAGTVSAATCRAIAPETVTHRSSQEAASEPPTVPTSAPDLMPVSLHRETVSTLQAALTAVRADLESERHRHTAEIERLVGQIHAERSFWVERADRAEVMAEQAMNERDAMARTLAEMARPPAGQGEPWWQRWFGSSTRSKLGGGS